MIICDFCTEENIVWEKDGMHMCEEHDIMRREGEYERYQKTYGINTDRHRPMKGLFSCELCGHVNNCECHYCFRHCLKSLSNLKDKNKNEG